MKLSLSNGPEIEVTVRAIPLKRWPEAARAHVNGDEFHLVALATGLLRNQVEELQPEQYSQLYQEVERLNADFFAYASRQLVIAAMSRAMLEKMSSATSAAG